MKSSLLFGVCAAVGALALFGAGCSVPSQLSSVLPSSSTPSASSPYSTQYAPTEGGSATTTDGQVSPPLQGLDVTFMSDNLRLHGYLSKPPGNGPFPAIIYNHGSEDDPAASTPAYQYFVSQGYVVFVPVRRGHGDSEGTDESDLTNEISAGPQRQQAVVSTFNKEVDDVTNGINYVKSLPYVDQNRLAVAGCSYGGIMTLLAADQPNTGVKVALDFSGAAESWSNTYLQQAMKGYVDKSTVPVFFLQAQNDYDTSPTTVLSAEMTKDGKSNKAKIYPPVGTTVQQGHSGFCEGSPQVWGSDAINYIQSYFPAAASSTSTK
ncbi:MAG: CocE/NonD family hydrolase [Patescibacteria group bacterium]